MSLIPLFQHGVEVVRIEVRWWNRRRLASSGLVAIAFMLGVRSLLLG